MKFYNFNKRNELKPENKPIFRGFSIKQISLFFFCIFVLQFLLAYLVSDKYIYSVSLHNLLIFVESAMIPIIFFICIIELKKTSNVNIKPWVLLFISTLFNFLGDFYNFIYGLISQNSVEKPLGIDIFYILFYPIFIWGLLSFRRDKISKSAKIKLALDISIFNIAFIIIITTFILGSLFIVSNNNTQIYFEKYEHVTSIIFPILDLLCLFVVVYLFLHSGIKIQRGALSLLELGTVFYVLSDLVYFI